MELEVTVIPIVIYVLVTVNKEFVKGQEELEIREQLAITLVTALSSA